MVLDHQYLVPLIRGDLSLNLRANRLREVLLKNPHIVRRTLELLWKAIATQETPLLATQITGYVQYYFPEQFAVFNSFVAEIVTFSVDHGFLTETETETNDGPRLLYDIGPLADRLEISDDEDEVQDPDESDGEVRYKFRSNFFKIKSF